ncbi:MAG TPA: sugar-binding protein [Kofleriaceae bacterium]|nr:sugar-binding protein [Kofleriaceae bacterium]
MRGTRLEMMFALPIALLAAGCSFDTRALGGGGVDPGDGDGAGADGAPATPDGGAAPAPDGAPPDAQVESTARLSCGRTQVPPALDGAPMGPWVDADFIQFAARDGELVADAHPSYGFDGEVSFACLHDDENVYFFADVVDSELVANSASLREDDGIVIFLDGIGDRDGTYGEDDHALMVGAEAEVWDYGPGDLVPVGEVVASEAGYRVEIALDKVAIASALPAELGFNLAIIDDDGKGNPDRDVFALRHVAHQPACARCCDGQAAPWCDTTQLGSLDLVDP